MKPLLRDLLFSSVLIFLSSASAQELEFSIDKNTGRVIGAIKKSSIEQETKSRVAISLEDLNIKSLNSASALIAETSEKFGIKDLSEIKLTSISKDPEGGSVVRHRQVYSDIPVYGHDLVVRVNPDGEAYSINGSILEDLNIDTTVILKPGKAERIAIADITKRRSAKLNLTKINESIQKRCSSLKSRKNQVVAKCKRGARAEFNKNRKFHVTQAPRLFVFNLESLRGLNSGINQIVYAIGVVNGFSDGEEIFINAQSGEVVWRSEANDSATERWVYDCSNPKGDNLCYSRLGPASNPPYTAYSPYVFGRREGAPVRGPNPLPGESFGSTDVDDVYDMLGSDAEPHLKSLYSFFKAKFNRNGGNGLGGIGDGVCTTYPTLCVGILGNDGQGAGRGIPVYVTKVNVNVNGIDFGNPRFCQPGNAEFAHFPIEEPSIKLCRGTTAFEILGHEYAHALPWFMNYQGNGSFNPTLRSEGESRAVNEAHSDLIAVAFQYYMEGESGPIDWTFGDDSNVPVKRVLSDPASSDYFDGAWKPYPDNYNSPTFYCGAGDYYGIHINSTVVSHGAFLAAEGGDFNGCHLEGIGLEKVLQIWNRALTHYFTFTTTFNAAYFGLTNSCNDFASGMATPNSGGQVTNEDCVKFARALEAVEIDLQGGCINGQPANYNLTPTCFVQQPPSADYNNDGVTDYKDYDVIRREWQSTGPNLLADANDDGLVNDFDYNNYINQLNLNPKPGRPGLLGECAGLAYDNEGVLAALDATGNVDGADFLFWQRQFGLTGPAWACDLNQDESVDAADYTIWRDNFGNGN